VARLASERANTRADLSLGFSRVELENTLQRWKNTESISLSGSTVGGILLLHENSRNLMNKDIITDLILSQLFRYHIPRSVESLQNLLKIKIGKMLYFTQNNFALFCEMITKLPSISILTFHASIEPSNERYNTGKSLCRMSSKSKIVSLHFGTSLRLFDALEFSKSIKNSWSLKHLTLTLDSEKKIDHHAMFRIMYNISRNRGLIDICISMNGVTHQDLSFSRDLDKINYSRFPKKVFKIIGPYVKTIGSALDKNCPVALLAASGGSRINMNILLTLLLIRQRVHMNNGSSKIQVVRFISQMIPALFIRIALLGSCRTPRIVVLKCQHTHFGGWGTQISCARGVGCSCQTMCLSDLGGGRSDDNACDMYLKTRWSCPHCGMSFGDVV